MRTGFRRGLGVLAVITALMGGALSGCAAETDTPADVSAQLEATYAGRADDGQTFVVAVRSGTSFMVYACDDARDAWFRAESLVSPMELTDAQGNALLLALDDDDEGGARGAITFGDAEPIPFVLDRTEDEVLFRAEGVMSGERLLGGWIRLPDGEQRGVVRRATTATTSRVEIGSVTRITAPEGLQRLGPAAFTPPALQAPTRARPEPFELYGLGDSYGAGEGAPEIPGDYENNGTLREGGDREEWNASLTTDAARREARACHRSGISGIEVAADILREDYRGALDVRLTPLACSGAQSEHFHTCSYRGAIGDHYSRAADFQPPQIARMREAAAASGVDAVYMSIGGNDMRFGPIVSACLEEAVKGETMVGDICGPGTPVDEEMIRMSEEMPERYGIIARELAGVLPREHVYLSQYPNPLADAEGDACSVVDVFGLPFGRITAGEAEWISSTVVPRLNLTVARGASEYGWRLVSGHLERFRGHGYCSDDPWFVDNPTSLRLQGDWMTQSLNSGDFPLDTCIAPAETREDVSPAAPATVAGGVVHPSADGYLHGYGPAIADSMRLQVENHLRPLPVGNLRLQAQRAGANVLIAWDDRASTETEYRVVVRTSSSSFPPPTVLRADSTAFEIALSGRASGIAEVTPCYVGPAPARREVCGETRTISYSNFSPGLVPSSVRVDTSRRAPVRAVDFARTPPQREVRVRWTTTADPGVVYYDVELEGEGGSRVRRATTESSLLATAQLRTARVRACNFVGCSPPSLVANGPGCAEGQVLSLDRTCIAGQSLVSSTRDLQCEQAALQGDPGGICSR